VKGVQGCATICDRTTWQELQPMEQCLGLCPTMRIHPTHHDVHALGTSGVCGFEHGVGFAHTSHGTKEDLEFTTGLVRLFLLHTGQQDIGVGPGIVHTHYASRPARPVSLCSDSSQRIATFTSLSSTRLIVSPGDGIRPSSHK